MKKKLQGVVAFATLVLVSVTATNTYAQKEVEKGTVAIDAYYGFPNLLTTAVKAIYSQETEYETYKVSGFGPAGIRGEYFITDHIAFGADINYSNTNVEWTENRDEYIGGGLYITHTYNYKVSVPRLRALGKFNFHFGASEHFDWYAGAGLGYNHTAVTFTSNDPNYVNEDLKNALVIPVTGRIDFGGKFYFTDNIGLGFEVGLGGGPLASLGICAKF